jgi:hypothetical protein
LGKPLGVDLNGKPQAWSTLLPHLLTIHANEGLHRSQVWTCRCEAGDCANVPEGVELPGGVWSRCPYAVLRSPQFASLVTLDELAAVSPLQDWPHGWAAWVSFGIVAMRKRRPRAG